MAVIEQRVSVGWARQAAHTVYAHLWRIRGAARLVDLLSGAGPPTGKSLLVRIWGGNTIELPSSLLSLAGVLWRRGVYEALTSALLLELARDACVYDIGANVGYFSVIASSSGARLVACVEPYAPNITFLKRNTAVLSSEVLILECALGAERGEVDLYGGGAWGDGSVSAAPTCSSERVARVSVEAGDNLFRDKRLPAPDILKIDVEGYELHVLRGLEQTLRAALPILFIELNSNTLRVVGHSPDDVVAFLKSVGYDEFHDVDERHLRPLHIGQTFNALAISRSRQTNRQRLILARYAR